MTFERRTWWIGRILAVLLILVSLMTAYWQLWRGRALDPLALNPSAAAREYARMRGDPTPAVSGEAASLVQLPQPVIQRTVQLLSTIQRGKIYDRDGNVLAEDRGTPGDFTRVYLDQSLAHTIGYASALRTGIMGLESTYNRQLLGLDRPDTQIDRMLRRPITGSSLVLTIDSQVQQAAVQGLAGRPGAIVALDGQTGAVLAMVSEPTFDPNRINNSEYAASLQNTTIMINRATQALYTPGSVFKTVTLIAALDSRNVNPRTIFDFGEPQRNAEGRIFYTYEVDGGLIYDQNHPENQLTLERSFVASANVAFAKMAHDMPADTFIDYAARMGFSTQDYARRFPLELPVAAPQLANNVEDIRNNDLLRAHTGYGQGELLVTPINMAIVTQAVLNNGTVNVPYLVEEIRGPQDEIIDRKPNDHTVRGIMSADTAAFVRQSMIEMNKAYYGENFLPGVVSGGKTGTAQLGGDAAPHAWYIGFAEREGRSVIVAIVVENAGAGSSTGAPIFQQIANAYFQQTPAQP